jgi:hypothetical protein
MRSACALSRYTRAEIAAYLGFPGSRAATNVLRQRSPEACGLRSLFYLHRVMTSSDVFQRRRDDGSPA